MPFANRAFEGTTVYQASDMPLIDALVITHDHWDHLDHASVLALKDRTARVVCGLGTGAHFARWGFEKGRILEGDWGGTLELFPDVALHLTTARHFSRCSLSNHDRALWCGFMLETSDFKLFHSGDGGYSKRFGPVDLAVLDSGQNNERWPTVHMFSHEAARAAEDVGARHFLPAHPGRFCLPQHPWDEPLTATLVTGPTVPTSLCKGRSRSVQAGPDHQGSRRCLYRGDGHKKTARKGPSPAYGGGKLRADRGRGGIS